MKAEKLDKQLAEATAIIRALQDELNESNQGLVALHMELDERVQQRTAELAQANESLREEVAERHRAEEKIYQRNLVLQSINRIFESALICHTEEDLGVACLSVAEELTQSKFGFLGEINENGLQDVAISNPGWDACAIRDANGKQKPPGNFKIHGIYGRVISDGKGLFTNNPARHPDSIGLPKGHPPLESFLGVPLIREERTIGMIALGNRDGGYTVVEQQAIEALAPAVVEAFMRKRAEEALRESEERFRLLVEGVKDYALFMLDPEGRVASWNLGAQQMLGYLSNEILGQSFKCFYTPEDLAQNAPTRELSIAKERNQTSVEGWRIRKDGSRFWAESVITPLHNVAGELRGFAKLTRDITERKRAASELQEANAGLEKRVEERTRELAQRAAQLRALAGELTLAEQRERSRLAKILHDHLQQLLVAAKLRTAVLERGGDELVRKVTKEVVDLIDESIAASRSLTAELSPPILHEAGLNAGLQWLARRMIDQHGLLVILETESDGDLSEPIKILLFESVRELLFNVVKHAYVQSATVHSRRINDCLQVIVSDQGIGFNPSTMPAAGEGTGFGLFSIRERLDLLGGSLAIESNQGLGSRFILTVPVIPGTTVRPQSQPTLIVPEALVVPSQYATPGRRIRVMLADDHAVVRQGIANMLGDEPDIEVIGEAADGQEAVEAAGNLLPDVILMDLSMPKLNGVEATRIIHNDWPGIRIIGLSMFEEVESAQAMRDAGAVSYITKSGPAKDLINAIRTSIRGSNKFFSATIPH